MSLKSNGDSQVAELKRRAQSLYDHKDLDNEKKVEFEQRVTDTETQWTTVLQAAEETQRYKGLILRLNIWHKLYC